MPTYTTTTTNGDYLQWNPINYGLYTANTAQATTQTMPGWFRLAGEGVVVPSPISYEAEDDFDVDEEEYIEFMKG